MTENINNDEIKISADSIADFSKDAEDFIRNIESIEVLLKHVLIEDIEGEEVSEFIIAIPSNIRKFIHFILRVDDHILDEYIAQAKLAKKDVSTLKTFRKKYKMLAPILSSILLHTFAKEIGLKNILTGVRATHKYNYDIEVPVVELDILSVGKSVLHTENPLPEIYDFSLILQNVVIDSLKKTIQNKLEIKPEIIERMQKTAEEFQRKTDEIITLLEKLKNKEKVEEK